jgi:hypothetical protein
VENRSEEKGESQAYRFIQSPLLRSLAPIPLMLLVALIHRKLQSPILLLRVSCLNIIIMTVTFQQEFWRGHSNQSSPQCVIAIPPASGDRSWVPLKGIFLSFPLFLAQGHQSAHVLPLCLFPWQKCAPLWTEMGNRVPYWVLGVRPFMHLLLHSLITCLSC